jgi:hypothetical protein
MNKTFKNDLQTCIQNLGVKDKKFILHETQHPLDKWLHEGFIGDNLYRIGDQRRTTARGILRTELSKEIQVINNDAIRHQLTQNEELLNTGNYTLSLQAKRPSKKLNTTRLRTELIKLGVSQDVIDAAYASASEEQDPVNVFTINTTGNGI